MKHVIQFEQVSRRFTVQRDRRNSFHELFTGMFRPRLDQEVFWALRDVSFNVGRGETIGLIGHNGSGKSTTLKLITRIIQPSQGRVVVDGRVSALLELGSGFHPDLTGRENIYLNGSLLGFTRAEMAGKIEKIIDFSEMREFIDMPVKHYSSGMYMRLGFAVAIYVDPDILITDEVLAVGDESFQRKCMEQIYALKKRGKTILFVSHALAQVRDLCDRALWFHHGQLMVDGPPNDAIDDYLIEVNQQDSARRRAESETAEQHEDGAAVAESDPPVEIETDPHRWGNFQAEIADVEFLDASGTAGDTAHTGEPLTIRIHYVAHRRIEKPVFGIAIHHRNGLHINGPNSRFSDLVIPAIEGRGYVDYSIADLPLIEGDYEITAAIYDWTLAVPFDHHDRRWSIHVYSRTIAERYGIVYIPATWAWHAEPDARSSS